MVIIDILRASSTICVALAGGAKQVIPVGSREEAFAYKSKGYLLAGERNGKKVKGFYFGNSPYEYLNGKIKDKTIVLTTTNGTKAIELSKGADEIVIGSFLNLAVLCDWLIRQNKDVLLLCAGWKNKFNLEDTLFAGAIVHQTQGHFETNFDAAIAAKQLYEYSKNDLFGHLKNASHYKRLAKLGIKKDIQYCLTPNQAEVIPILKHLSLIIEH